VDVAIPVATSSGGSGVEFGVKSGVEIGPFRLRHRGVRASEKKVS